MPFLVVSILLVLIISAVVMGYVAVEARKEERQFWTPEGERLIAEARRRGEGMRDRGDAFAQRTKQQVGRASQRGPKSSGESSDDN
ncbi:hypothetical protein [Ornithinimicrobium sp. INDO-MA30-4]|uniref:hypothetical protein n=1 Tax=Ornithinimicrobium sp. INDO-MA30-4 TaxID=2908651 RepID=UPI001F207F9A|nr:hypothetical protein [Ornithinimicrobium sp. INDO-MA30-4]UJH70803.1 hypothetical protein L0A91_01885 [Ornithinimicrobium sp. INDO-MA30-4]